MKYVYVTKFVPLTISHGPSITATMELDKALSRINDVVDKVLNELTIKIETTSSEVISSGISISQVTIGNVIGLVVIAWALIK